MEAAAHNPKFAKAAKIPQSVAQEFVDEDKQKKAVGVAQSMLRQKVK